MHKNVVYMLQNLKVALFLSALTFKDITNPVAGEVQLTVEPTDRPIYKDGETNRGLNCKITGITDVNPKLSWFSNLNKSVTSRNRTQRIHLVNETSSSLMIHFNSLTPRDAGTWRCDAKIPGTKGVKSKTVEVVITDLNRISPCETILRKKGYFGVIETSNREPYLTTISTTNPLCRVGEKFSNELFTDPEAWLCLGGIVQLMSKNRTLYERSLNQCNITNRWNDIACGQFAIFQNCIDAKMQHTLHGLASGEPRDEKACTKCSEYYELRYCAKKGNLDTECPASTRHVLNRNFALKSCITCGEQAQREGKPTLWLGATDHECDEASTQCQDCKEEAQHSRKVNEIITTTCEMNASVFQSYSFKWYFALDDGQFYEVKHGIFGAAISDVPDNFTPASFQPLEKKTTTLRLTTPQPGKILTLRCTLVSNAQGVVTDFHASTDICIVGGRKTQKNNGQDKENNNKETQDEPKKTQKTPSKWIFISVAAVVVIICVAISVHYYNRYLDAKDDAFHQQEVNKIKENIIRSRSRNQSFTYKGKLVIDVPPSKHSLSKQKLRHNSDDMISDEEARENPRCASVRTFK